MQHTLHTCLWRLACDFVLTYGVCNASFEMYLKPIMSHDGVFEQLCGAPLLICVIFRLLCGRFENLGLHKLTALSACV